MLQAGTESEFLIERFFPFERVSEVGTRERYFHGRTPHSVHVWWARRPFSAMRAIVFASLVPYREEDASLLEEICLASLPSPLALEISHNSLFKAWKRPPRVLDVFGGGGTIALEAARLGCEVVSLDINPLACFVQRTLLQYSQAHPELPILVRNYGERFLWQLKKETNELYRRDKVSATLGRPAVFFWGRTVRCSNQRCGKVISLSRIGWLSKKPGRSVFLTQRPNRDGNYRRELHFNPKQRLPTNDWETTRGITCPFCHRFYDKNGFQALTQNSLGSELICVCVMRNGTKSYIVPQCPSDFVPTEEELQRKLDAELHQIGMTLPNTELPCWSGIVNPALYGITRHANLFNPRQLVILLKVIRGLREIYETMLKDGHKDTVALAVTATLSGFIDQLVDWNSVLSMWIPENEQVGRALAGPGLPMLWDYVEIDPFSDAPANLPNKLNRIVKGLEAIPRFPVPVEVQCCSATSLPFDDESFDAVITDPPYGDNLFYSVLSDCIYVWKRVIFKDLISDLFAHERTPSDEEIVASAHRHGSFEEAMSFYQERLALAIQEVARVLRSQGILSLVFTHSTLDAWGAIVHAFRRTGMVVTACYPLHLERRARPRGMSAKAVHASVVLVARKKPFALEVGNWEEIRLQIERELHSLVHELRTAGWDETDIGMACFAKAVGIIAKYASIQKGGRELPVRSCLEQSADLVRKFSPSLPLRPNITKSVRL